MGSNPTCSPCIVLVGVINDQGIGVPPYYRTAVFDWVGVWRSSAWVGGSGRGWPSYYVTFKTFVPTGASAYYK